MRIAALVFEGRFWFSRADTLPLGNSTLMAKGLVLVKPPAVGPF